MARSVGSGWDMMKSTPKMVRRLRSRNPAVVDDLLVDVVEALRLPDLSDRFFEAIYVESILAAKATRFPEAAIADAAVRDIILSDLKELQKRSRKNMEWRRHYDAMFSRRQAQRNRMATTPEFESRVTAFKETLLERVAAGD